MSFKDEDAHRIETEELNGFPEMRLILNPGGCAEYKLPVETDQQFAIIHPARKDVGGPYENYCPKAKVDVTVEANGLKANFNCFLEADSCSSSSCAGSFASVLSEDVAEVQLSLCVADTDPNTAAIWEIDISKVRLTILNVFFITFPYIFFIRQMNPVKFKEFLWMVLERDSN